MAITKKNKRKTQVEQAVVGAQSTDAVVTQGSVDDVKKQPASTTTVQQGGVGSIDSKESRNGGLVPVDGESLHSNVTYKSNEQDTFMPMAGQGVDASKVEVQPVVANEKAVSAGVPEKEVDNALPKADVQSVYGIDEEQVNVAKAHPNYAGLRGQVDALDEASKKKGLDYAARMLNDPNVKGAQRDLYLAYWTALVDSGAKTDNTGLYPTESDNVGTAKKGGTTQGNVVSGSGDDSKPIGYETRDDRSAKLQQALGGNGGDGTQNGGQSASGTTSTKGLKGLGVDTTMRVGGEAYMKKMSDLQSRRDRGEVLSLQDEYDLFKFNQGSAKSSGDVNGKKGDGVLTEADVKKEEKKTPDEDNLTNKQKIANAFKERGMDDATVKKFGEMYDKNPSYFDTLYSHYTEAKTKEKDADVDMPELKIPDAPEVKPYVSAYTQQLMKAVEAARENPEDKAKREKSEKSKRILAGVFDVLSHAANIWGAVNGATPAQLSSISGATEGKIKEDRAAATAALDKANKELAKSVESDRKVSELENKNAFEKWKATVSAITKKYEIDRKTISDRMKAASKASDEALKSMFRILEESVKHENRMAEAKVVRRTESTRNGVTHVYNHKAADTPDET